MLKSKSLFQTTFADEGVRALKSGFSTFSTSFFSNISTSHNCHYVNYYIKKLEYYIVKEYKLKTAN